MSAIARGTYPAPARAESVLAASCAALADSPKEECCGQSPVPPALEKTKFPLFNGLHLVFIVFRKAAAPHMHNLMTVKETAEYLRIPLPTVYYLVQRGQLPAIQIGGRWRVKKDALDRDVLRNEQTGQPTVLVVDDDEALQDTFKLFLKKAGFSRLVVGTGKEALAALAKQQFDLCFLDLQLPDITGDEIYAVAKEQYPEMPVVIITGYPDSEMMNNILKHGPVTVLKKPLRVEDLHETLRHLGHKETPKGKKAA